VSRAHPYLRVAANEKGTLGQPQLRSTNFNLLTFIIVLTQQNRRSHIP